jgi:hypothetical protein
MAIKETYIFENPGCKRCEHWKRSDEQSLFRGEELGCCDHLDNDFCCGGRQSHEAGVIGGGNFLTKGTFWCKFFTHGDRT